MNNYDMEKCHHLLQRLEELVNTDILANRQELKSMDNICRLNKGEITADECMIGLQEALQYTVSLESIKEFKEGADIYLTCAELGCLYSIVMKFQDKTEDFNIDLLQSIARQCIPEYSANIGMYELIMCGVASRLGDAGEYERATEISKKIIKECLAARRMGMLHCCLYDILWNWMETVKKDTSAESGISAAQELQKCIQLARLCKETFYEEFYSGKL